MKNQTVYVLKVIVDPSCSPSAVVEDTIAASLDRDKLIPLMEKEERRILNYFGFSGDPDSEHEIEEFKEESQDDGDICYRNRDLDSFPSVCISEIELL